MALLDGYKPVVFVEDGHFLQPFFELWGGPEAENLAEVVGVVEGRGLVLKHDVVGPGDAHEVIAAGHAEEGEQVVHVVLVGVSRSSKTPTCMYLANRGVNAANIPIIPGLPLPPELFALDRKNGPLIVGLTKDAESLVQFRRNRLRLLSENQETDYIDPEIVRQEISQARRVCSENEWPVIDVTRRSIEESAAAILQLLEKRLHAK